MPSLVGSEMCIRDSFVACGEDAGSVFLQQGIVTVDIERTVSPADSQVDSPMRVLLEVVIYGEDVDCLLYTSDAADDLLCVDLGGRRIIKKKTLYR